MRAFDALVRDGLVRHLGASNYAPQGLPDRQVPPAGEPVESERAAAARTYLDAGRGGGRARRAGGAARRGVSDEPRPLVRLGRVGGAVVAVRSSALGVAAR
jgi:hypothetical protein